MFRLVELPPETKGTLFLHSMPGRFEPYSEAATQIVAAGVRRVVCLAPMDEIRQKSPEYAVAIERGLSWEHISHPVPDFGVPDDVEGFRRVIGSVVGALKSGENVLVHCAAGIGRTGTFAVAVLLVLGVSLPEAQQLVRHAGSRAETEDQVEFLRTLAKTAGT